MDIKIKDFIYDLPDERIAKFPLEKRDFSKLLVFKDGNTFEDAFAELSNYIPENSLMVFNDTKVVKARFIFKKETGAEIEMFCLEPAEGMHNLEKVFLDTEKSEWICLIGNAGKWKAGKLKLNEKDYTLTAEKFESKNGYYMVNFVWDNKNISWRDIMNISGNVPLPPYINRKPNKSDEERYQTIFANSDGSVAAPTASLHFTEQTLEKLKEKNIKFEFLTLHVGAGTFKPVTSENVSEHKMHQETFFITKKFIENLYNHSGRVIPVGTTSMRTLESMYWLGVKLAGTPLQTETCDYNNGNIFVPQWIPYNNIIKLSPKEALKNILNYMAINSLDILEGETEIIIVPGYEFKFTDALITNFHQPGSTLLLLVAALIGEDWRNVYKYAIENKFRFLSYGDSSILFKKVKGT